MPVESGPTPPDESSGCFCCPTFGSGVGRDGYGVQVYLGTDARNGLSALAAQDVSGTINQTADQVSCQDTNPFG
jgi:hypothetical protein